MKTLSPLGKKQILEAISAVNIVVKEAIFLFGSQLSDWKSRHGGYFCLADGANGFPLLVVPVGEVPLEKTEKYLRLCQEKAKRLAEHPEHSSSWESRDPGQEQWGGAVRVSHFIFSFSGLPELGDEAVMLVAAECHLPLTSEVTRELHVIATHSNNNLYDSLRKFKSRDM